MASYFSKGSVLEGAYQGNYVYGMKDDQLQLFGYSSINKKMVDRGQIKLTALIDRTTVKTIEILQEREKGYCEVILCANTFAELHNNLSDLEKSFPALIEKDFIDKAKEMLLSQNLAYE